MPWQKMIHHGKKIMGLNKHEKATLGLLFDIVAIHY